MDGLFDALDDFASDANKLPAVRMAAKRGITVMQKYYGKSDESSVFRIAMSMFFSCHQLFCFIVVTVQFSILLSKPLTFETTNGLRSGSKKRWVFYVRTGEPITNQVIRLLRMPRRPPIHK
jgi:hypothetical protein